MNKREITCSTCGQRVPSGTTCLACAVVAAPEHAEIVKITAPSLDHELEPSIRKEYHHSFLRIMVSFGLAWFVIIAIVAFSLGGRPLALELQTNSRQISGYNDRVPLAAFMQDCRLMQTATAPTTGRLALPLTTDATPPHPRPLSPGGERGENVLAPTSRREMDALGWKYVDVVFVTGDAYIDHPSFAMAILHRVLEQAGFRVAILSQPDWHSCEPWRQFGRPRLFFAISAGNMDSMINHYTASKKVRNDDAYSPGGRIGLRPDRATLPYCHRAREAFPGVPIIAGGVEASLRRLAHYDYWSDTVRKSILLDAKADLVVYGMGEHPIVEIAQRLAAGKTVKDLRDMRGVAYVMGATESDPALRGLSPSAVQRENRLALPVQGAATTPQAAIS